MLSAGVEFASFLADTSPALVSASGALLGVLIGGVINWRLQRASERRREENLARAGARLVRAELMAGADALELAADEGSWRQSRKLQADAWVSYREHLATTLDPERWDIVAQGVLTFEALAARLERLSGPGATLEVPEQLRSDIRAKCRPIREAIRGLACDAPGRSF